MKLLAFISIICLAAVITANMPACKSQEKEIPILDTSNVQWRIERDTVYIDRSRPINKPWYSYEIESSEDSIYLYSGRELIKALSREDATVFAIDSLIVLDKL